MGWCKNQGNSDTSTVTMIKEFSNLNLISNLAKSKFEITILWWLKQKDPSNKLWIWRKSLSLVQLQLIYKQRNTVTSCMWGNEGSRGKTIVNWDSVILKQRIIGPVFLKNKEHRIVQLYLLVLQVFFFCWTFDCSFSKNFFRTCGKWRWRKCSCCSFSKRNGILSKVWSQYKRRSGLLSYVWDQARGSTRFLWWLWAFFLGSFNGLTNTSSQ